MEFILAYEGPLKVNASLEDKQSLRRNFHSQLKVLWEQVPLMNSKILLRPADGSGGISIIQSVGTFNFVPLICENLQLIANLKITMLRPEPPGRIITQSGDIDNRLKTLFDSLRVPKVNELVNQDNPKEEEKPFYCLLEDDNLITKVSVVTERWLRPNANKNDVLLIIHVTTSAVQTIWKNVGLG